MKLLTLVLTGMVLFSSAQGCARPERFQRNELSIAAIRSIQPGSTYRSDVELKLGSPDRVIRHTDGELILIYESSWRRWRKSNESYRPIEVPNYYYQSDRLLVYVDPDTGIVQELGTHMHGQAPDERQPERVHPEDPNRWEDIPVEPAGYNWEPAPY